MIKRTIPQFLASIILLLMVLLPFTASADLARQGEVPELPEIPEPELAVILNEGPVEVIESTNQRLSFALNTSTPTQSADGTVAIPELEQVIQQPVRLRFLTIVR